MALVFLGKTTCSLCGAVFVEGEDVVGTPHFIEDTADPLWRYSEAAMHQSCFTSWELRLAFIGKYNSTVGQRVWGNGTRNTMLPDGSIVQESVVPPGEEAR